MEEKSDYDLNKWMPMSIIPDLIPVVGAVTFTERERRYKRLSLRDFYLNPLSDIASWISIGTSKWPEPEDEKALARSVLLAARNVAFSAYHAFSPLIILSILQGK